MSLGGAPRLKGVVHCLIIQGECHQDVLPIFRETDRKTMSESFLCWLRELAR